MDENQQNLKFLGKIPDFPALGNCWLTKEGFIVSDDFGGPRAKTRLDAFQPREDDVFVVSYPKTGTTWLQEIVYLVGTNCDFDSAKKTHVFRRCPYLDFARNPTVPNEIPPPRFYKLHLPYSLIPKAVIDKKCKLLYTMRNPKDTLVSNYYFCKRNKSNGYDGDFPTFFELFLNDKVCYGPYWKHYLEFWERRHQENIFITTYEDMKQDLPDVIRRIANFLGKKLTDEQMEKIAHHCQFEQMSKNPSTNPDFLPDANNFLKFDDKKTPVFMRKGEVGDWKNHFSEDMNQRMSKSIEEHFGGTGLNFIYEL